MENLLIVLCGLGLLSSFFIWGFLVGKNRGRREEHDRFMRVLKIPKGMTISSIQYRRLHDNEGAEEFIDRHV